MNEQKHTDPLSFVIDFLNKTNEKELATQVVQAFEKYSENTFQYNIIAKLYHELNDIDKAKYYATKVLNNANNLQEKVYARFNLAKIYNDLYEPEKTLPYLKANDAILDNDLSTKLELAKTYILLNDKEKAQETLYNFIKETDLDSLNEKDREMVKLNMSSFNFMNGEFQEGLKNFFISIANLGLWFNHNPLPFPFWQGQEIQHGTPLVLYLKGGGIGDEFLSVRYIPMLEILGFSNIIYFTERKNTCDIFNENGYRAITSIDEIPPSAVWTFALHVPMYLNLKPEEVLLKNYLKPSNKAIEKWKYLEDGKRPKIGIRWMGAEGNEKNLHRNIKLKDIMDKLSGIDAEFYSLQINDGTDELRHYPDIIDLSDNIKSYDDTFAILKNLDYVITSCTSVLHASAIVGTPTYALIPLISYFTWLSPPTEGRPENSSIWYDDNLKLYRQTKVNDWSEPLDKLVEDIRISL